MGSDKKKKPNEEVTYYDVAAGTTRTGKPKALASKSSTKDTVNLCIHERKGLSIEMFFLILAAILLVLLVIEYFCAYRPYVKLEEAQRTFAAREAELHDIKDQTKDYDDVLADYRKFNYENFPRERVDRDDVFQLVEEVVFGRALITSYILRENTLTLQLSGVRDDDLNKIPAEIEEYKIDSESTGTETGSEESKKKKFVKSYDMPRADVKYDETTMTSSFGITIVFVDANSEENQEENNG